MVQRQLAIRDVLQNPVHLFLGHPALHIGEIGTKAHVSANSLTMKHASRELIARAPGVAICVRSALVCLPKIAVLRSYVTLHGFADDEVADVLELSIVHAVALCTKLGLHSTSPMLLHELEEGEILHHCHLDDLGNAVSQPSRMKSPPEATVCDGQHRRVVRTIEILVVKAVAADTRRWPSINARNDGGAQHHVRRVPRIQGGGKTCDVCNHTTTNHQERLMSTNSVLFHGNKNPLNVLNALVHFVATENELGELNVVGGEVVVNVSTVILINLVINHGNAAAKRLVDIKEEVVARVQDVARNLDGGSIWGCQGQGVALPVDGSGIDCMRIGIF